MKTFFCFFFLSTAAFAVTLEKYQSSPEGIFRQSFDVTAAKATHVRGSNAFDETENDYRIGTLTLDNPSLVKDARAKLEKLAMKYQTIDNVLKKEEGKSFNDLAGPFGHKIIYRLNGYVVQPESNYYKDLEVIFQELKKQDWKLSSGYEISSKLDEVTEYVSGKKKQSYEFAKGTYCDRGSLKCTYYGGGTLRVPKGSL